MTDNEKLARWQGCTFVNDSAEGCVFTPPNKPKSAWQPFSKLPDYLNCDAAAMSLLDTLVEKGYIPILDYNMQYLGWVLDLKRTDSYVFIDNKFFPTRREAVVAVVLELIGKEDV